MATLPSVEPFSTKTGFQSFFSVPSSAWAWTHTLFSLGISTEDIPEQLVGGGFTFFYFHSYLGNIPNLTDILQGC